MNFGLGLNVNETTREIVKKCIQAEQLGLDYVWVADAPAQRYALTVASAVAANTKKLRVGVGLLSPFLYTPKHIANGFSTLVEAYGSRFELCIGPGDRNQLRRVGVSLFHPQGIANYILDSKRKIEKRLREKNIQGKIWLGAQGPKMLGIARFFDGVLLNYASPELVKWAISKVGLVSKRDFLFGVYAPSYVYGGFDKDVYTLLRIASAVVAIGALDIVLKKFRIYNAIVAAREKLESGLIIESILDEIPPEVVELFSIHKPDRELRLYVSAISRLGVKHIVFGYPQNFSEKTIRDLAQALFET